MIWKLANEQLVGKRIIQFNENGSYGLPVLITAVGRDDFLGVSKGADEECLYQKTHDWKFYEEKEIKLGHCDIEDILTEKDKRTIHDLINLNNEQAGVSIKLIEEMAELTVELAKRIIRNSSISVNANDMIGSGIRNEIIDVLTVLIQLIVINFDDDNLFQRYWTDNMNRIRKNKFNNLEV